MANRQLLLSDTDVIDQLVFEGISDRYTKVVLANIIVNYTIIILLPLALFLIEDFDKNSIIFVITEIILVIACISNLLITKKACLFKGYAIRENDISYRRGFILHKTTTVPFRKIQQVSIKQGILSRLFSLYSLEITNGAQFESSITIPGLTETKAESIKQLITEKIQNAE